MALIVTVPSPSLLTNAMTGSVGIYMYFDLKSLNLIGLIHTLYCVYHGQRINVVHFG